MAGLYGAPRLTPDATGTISPVATDTGNDATQSRDAGPTDISAWGDGELVRAYSPSRSPWLRLMMVTAANGSTIGPSGTSRDISGRRDVDLLTLLRAMSDAVLVGARTAVADRYGPVRVRPSRQHLRAGRAPRPRLCIVTGSGSLPADLLEQDPVTGLRPLLITSESGSMHLRDHHPTEDCIVAGAHQVDLLAALAEMRERGLADIDCEGGAFLARSLLDLDAIDEVDLSRSPQAGADGPTLPAFEAGWAQVHDLHEGAWRFTRLLRAR